jgi:hypothetical protein
MGRISCWKSTGAAALAPVEDRVARNKPKAQWREYFIGFAL